MMEVVNEMVVDGLLAFERARKQVLNCLRLSKCCEKLVIKYFE